MLPVHLAANIRRQVLFYLLSTFEFRDRSVEKAFARFVEDPENGLFKGTWVQLKRPFRPADPEEIIRLDFPVPFHPFKHQNRAWRRLSSRDSEPQTTIVTTGTGSGKTECFLYPILDHCLRARQSGQRGIKAIVLYPMNALAADQEKRFARVIDATASLKAAGIRVGNYTGRYDPADPGSSASSGTSRMGPDHGITSHVAQQEEPPDVLLTNYKMLDYLLLRPQDRPLWRFNAPGTLRYLVLDELHTYDGAQGADVACLIRRLKERLEIPRGSLCAVGTSATLDDRQPVMDARGPGPTTTVDTKETSLDRLARFASTLFEESIGADAVVPEDRLTVEEIVDPRSVDLELPRPEECEPREGEDALRYASRQAVLWGGPSLDVPAGAAVEVEDDLVERWGLEVGAWLKSARMFRTLLELFEQNEGAREAPLTWHAVVDHLSQTEFAFQRIVKHEDRDQLCTSFLALVAHARETRSGKVFPLVPTQAQIWIRELRRLGRLVHERPVFAWLDEPVKEYPNLPTFHCSECGESGWVALHDPDADSRIGAAGVEGLQLMADPTRIYRGWFEHGGGKSPHLVVLSPWVEDTPTLLEPGSEQGVLDFGDWFLCPKSLVLRKFDGPCPLTGDIKRFRVKVNRDTRRIEDRGIVVGDPGCSRCGSTDGVFFIGSQSATLSSVAIDEMFGSALNSDAKLLAFTDSVQDASHRAGFFSARTYQFTLRTALQHAIDAAGSPGVPLADAGRLLIDHWSHPAAGWPGGIKEAMATLLPPDLQMYPDYLQYRNSETQINPPRPLRADVDCRLSWEAASEFGLMQTHGRTLERAGSSTLCWDASLIEGTMDRVVAHLERIDRSLVGVSEKSLRIWLLGFLHRHRIRGALDHPYLLEYARKGFWGKHPFERAIEGREVHPLSGWFRPRLIITHSHKDHDSVLATSRGKQPPWELVWARRALQCPGTPEQGLLDLILCLLVEGTKVGLFRKLHQDGAKEFFAIAAHGASLQTGGIHLVCSQSGHAMVRPPEEAAFWEDAPSIDYHARDGRYRRAESTPRHRYYQSRYRKGVLRRVVAREHTGLLTTEEREDLEHSFANSRISDDPNVLTCTSTLEMGIDIGDLSSTLLCSIPPTTASYLQRIGRAGRATGTALIVSVVNQRPHDLFFYGRPVEMIRGRVDPPGCWLDASAVLVRQYLAFCFDSAVKSGQLSDIPRTGKQLVDDLAKSAGLLPRMLEWVTSNEMELLGRFLRRFEGTVQPDTKDRFRKEASTDLLRQRLHVAAGEFERMIRDLDNARKRLKDQQSKLDKEEVEARAEIERELQVLTARQTNLSRTHALEILTEHGLLPNYAFPERGVRFYGSVFDKSRRSSREHRPIEVSRPASTGLKELAPWNMFYTHSRHFDIQQIAIGNPQQPLVELWAICGACGHMRRVEELKKPDAATPCPQCEHDGDARSQVDSGQQRQFLLFARSQAISVMENYESLSVDKSDERERTTYQVVRSFDLTGETPVGVVGDEELPFGIEYRALLTMREVNVGFVGEAAPIPFGVGQQATDNGFRICRDCGVAIRPRKSLDDVEHRRSCRARRRREKLRQEGRSDEPFKWESVYLYRDLRSEAVRLLLPVADDADLDTLAASVHLGLRLRFEGNPAHLVVASHVMPEVDESSNRYHLVLLDAVPGGTGYLKSLYQEKDSQGRDGEGILHVLKLARDAMESCTCRQIRNDPGWQDTDGCYRCIRTYHLQYNAARISRERGIALLGRLITAGEKRLPQKELESIRPHSAFGSALEKKFVDALRMLVDKKHGSWETTIIRGNQGYRFRLPGSERLWELEPQPTLGLPQGVMIQSQPDFLLHCDDERIRPSAVFTDGFKFHAHPVNRLADDFAKRRAILQSGRYRVWNVTWDDLEGQSSESMLVTHPSVAQKVQQLGAILREQGQPTPPPLALFRNGFEQLKAFLEEPRGQSWARLAAFAAYFPLQKISTERTVTATELRSALEEWRSGSAFPDLAHTEGGGWVHCERLSLTGDLVAFIESADILLNRTSRPLVVARLGDSEDERAQAGYLERWRRFLACLNLFQFTDQFSFWAASEIAAGTAPDLSMAAPSPLDEAWEAVLKQVSPRLRPLIHDLAGARLRLPEALPVVEHFNDESGDDVFAELAWRRLAPPVALLCGEQASFAQRWQQQGWKVVTQDELQARGHSYLIELIERGLGGGK